ncbi:toxin glutamine deamidase domain-containing protein [Streptomyces sp. NPDC003077]|uniref:toxin glutamine deamidase domain-containing protein n=1 Tax=Streptomyces sp. NPDC003077 TaxID=3154443 RepID=UPI0033BF2A8F
MALMLPNGLEWVLEMCGFDWPTGNEDKMMECANTWRRFAADVQSLQARGMSAAGNVLAENTGDSIEGFDKTWEKFGGGSGYFDDAREGAELIAICLDAAAILIIGLKLAVIAQLVILAIEIVAAQAAAPFTLGLSELGAMGAVAATRLILRKLVKEAAQQILQAVLETAKEPFVSALEAMASDLVAQTVEQNFGKQSGYDLERTTKKGYEEGKEALKNSGSTFGESLRDGAGSRAGRGARDGLTNSGNDGGDGSSGSGNDSSSRSNDSPTNDFSSTNNNASPNDSSSSDSSSGSSNSSNSPSSSNSSSDESGSLSRSPSSSGSPSSVSGDSGRRAPDIGGPSSSSAASGSDSSSSIRSSSSSPSSLPDGPSTSTSSPSFGPSASTSSSPSSLSTPSNSSTDSTGNPGSSSPSSSPSPSRGSDSPSPFDVGTQAYIESIGRPSGDDSATLDSSPDASTLSTTTRPDVEGGPAPGTIPDSGRPDSTSDASPSTAPGTGPSLPSYSSPVEGPGTTPDVDGSPAPDTVPDTARPSRPDGVDVHTPQQGASIPDPRNTEPAPMPSPPPETKHPEDAPSPAPGNSRPEPGVHQVDRESGTTMSAPPQGTMPVDSHDGDNNDNRSQGSRASMPGVSMPGNPPTANPRPGQVHAPTPSTPTPQNPADENFDLMGNAATAAPPAPGMQPGEARIPQQAAPSSATPSTSAPGAMPPPTAGPIPTQAPVAGNPTRTPRATRPSATTSRAEQPSTRPMTPSRNTQQNRAASPPRTEAPRSATPRLDTPSRSTTQPRTDTPRAETPARPTTPPRGEQPTNRAPDQQSPVDSPTSMPNAQGTPAPNNQQPGNQQPDATNQTSHQNQPTADDGVLKQSTAPMPPPHAVSLSDIRDNLNIPFEGLTTPDPVHQQDLQNAHPRNPDGTPQVYADPRQGNWVGLQNDGGVGVPGRSNNCADCTRSFLETWFGRPTVSAPRTLDLNADGSLNTFSAEHDSVDNQARWAGAPSTYAGKDHPNPYARIAYDLSQAGHGSAAVIGVNWPGGGGHAFAAVNHNGQILFVDAQTGVVSETPIHLGAQEVFYTPLDANRNPITPYFLTPSTPQPSTQNTPDTTNSSGPDSSTDQSRPDARPDGTLDDPPLSTEEAPSGNDDATAEQNAIDGSTDTAPPSTTPESSTSPETTPVPETTASPETTSPQDGDASPNTNTIQESNPAQVSEAAPDTDSTTDRDAVTTEGSDATDPDSPQPDDARDTQGSQDSPAPQDTQTTQTPQDTDQQAATREPVFPSTTTRPSGPPDGYEDPTDADNRAQQESFPRNEDGSFQQAPDPREGTWVDDLRGQSPDESGRNVNCTDASLAFVESYAGNPMVAARRSPNEDGTPADTPEPNGRDRIENALGAEFEDFGDGRGAYDNLESSLRNEGHGSQAVIITQHADGRAHAWNVVNHNGQIVYADPQTGRHSTTPLHIGDNGVFAIPLDANRRPIETTNQRTTQNQGLATPADTDHAVSQRPAGSHLESQALSAEATRERRNQSLPDPEARTAEHAGLPPDGAQGDLRDAHAVHRIDPAPIRAQMRQWAQPQGDPPRVPLAGVLRESIGRRQAHAESARLVREARQDYDRARKEVADAKAERTRAATAERKAKTDEAKQAAQAKRAAAEQRLAHAQQALLQADATHKAAMTAHRDVPMPSTNFTDSDLRKHLDPAWSQMNDGQRYTAIAALARISQSFHANNAVGVNPDPAARNDVYNDGKFHESAAPWRRELASHPDGTILRDVEDSKRMLEETESSAPDFSGKNYAVVEVLDPDTKESHYIVDSSVPPAPDGADPVHSESHILNWIDQLNENREAHKQAKVEVKGLYTEREPCGLRTTASGHPTGHANCSKTIKDSQAMDGAPVYYSTTYRADPNLKNLKAAERNRLRAEGKTESQIKTELGKYHTPSQRVQVGEIRQHLEFVKELAQTLANPGQNTPQAPTPDQNTPPTQAPQAGPPHPAAPNRRPPSTPAGSGHRPPADSPGADRRPPAEPSGTPTIPADSERTPSANPANANSHAGNGTAGNATALDGTSAPTDSQRSNGHVSPTEIAIAGAGEALRPAATGAAEQTGARDPFADESREGSPASDDQPQKRGRFKRILQSLPWSGQAEPAEITTEVDQPRFGDHTKLAEFQPDRYGTPLDRPDGTRVPLFDGPPSREQTKQGAIGDCGIIATLGAVASRYPDLLQDMIRETEDGNYEVRFHEVARNNYGNQAPTGRILTVRVTPDLPVYSDFPSTTVYANANETGVAWPAIMEKAIAGLDQFWDDEKRADLSQYARNKDFDDKLLTGYSRIAQGSSSGSRAELLAQLTGRTSENHEFPTQYDMHGRSPERQLLAHLRELTESGRPVVIGTRSKGTGVENKMEKNLLSSHAYEIVSVDEKGLIQLRNPHNERHPQPLTIKEFMKYCNNQYASLEDEK